MPKFPDISDDLDGAVWGAIAIGRIVRRTDRQTYHLLSIGALPAKKIGATWVSTPRALLDAVTKLDDKVA